MNNQKTALYRHFNADNQLLYVGISLSAIHRLSQHKTSGWHDDIAKVDIIHFNNRTEALDAEKEAIKEENPRFNIAHRSKNTFPIKVKEKRDCFNDKIVPLKTSLKLSIAAKQVILVGLLTRGKDEKVETGTGRFYLDINLGIYSKLIGVEVDSAFYLLHEAITELSQTKIISGILSKKRTRFVDDGWLSSMCQEDGVCSIGFKDEAIFYLNNVYKDPFFDRARSSLNKDAVNEIIKYHQSQENQYASNGYNLTHG